LVQKLYLLSHHFEKTDAKQTINKEFIPNQVAGTSVPQQQIPPTFQKQFPNNYKTSSKITLP
jgi:hypothetical protein